MAAQNPSGAYFQTNLQRLRKIAEQKGLVFNPNSDWVNQVIRLMTDSKRDAGKYYCPCKQHHPPDPETDAACPCPTLDEEIAADGYCHCRLFFKKGFDKKKFNIMDTITCPG